jgi:hypothetical protein
MRCLGVEVKHVKGYKLKNQAGKKRVIHGDSYRIHVEFIKLRTKLSLKIRHTALEIYMKRVCPNSPQPALPVQGDRPASSGFKGLLSTLVATLSTTLSASVLAMSLGLPAWAIPARIIGDVPGTQVNIRSRPSTTATAPSYGLVGDRVEIIDNAVGSDGYRWYFVRFPESRVEGWIRSDFIRQETATQPTRWSHTYACGETAITLAESASQDYTYATRSPRGNLTLVNGNRVNSGFSWIYEFTYNDAVYVVEDAWESSRFPGGFAELRIFRNGQVELRQTCQK